VQVFVQNNVVALALARDKELKPPFFINLLDSVPFLRRLPAYAVGIGVRPEHVHTPARSKV
jgi:hypothetical protein